MNRSLSAKKDLQFFIFIMGILLSLMLFMSLTGCTGRKGDTGAFGQSGAVGPQGPLVPVLTQPATPTECPTGGVDITVGSTVSTICNGTNGANGQNGINGTNGANATPVTEVQLCPGTPSYPSLFPEYALCIEGTLYGVYSANGGFLAELPPGTYSSDGINDSCTLVIGPNCFVTN